MREVGSLYLEYSRLSLRRKVPSGVLSVLPGPGATTGKELVSHPLIRKVDITVSSCCAKLPGTTLNSAYFTIRQVQIQDVH